MKILLKHAMASALALGLSVSSMASNAEFADFTVNETNNGGIGSNIFVADKLNGGFTERVSIAGSSFATVGFADFGQFFKNEGTVLVNSDLGDTYNMYAVFSTTGGAFGGAGTLADPFTFDGGTGMIELFIDPDQDTAKAFSGFSVAITDPGSDDFLIASSTTLTQQLGFLFTGIGGFYDLIFDGVALKDPEGKAYFTSPEPFYLRTTVDGDFDTFSPVGTVDFSGDVSAVFVPEPEMLTLMGAAFLMFGAARRNRKA